MKLSVILAFLAIISTSSLSAQSSKPSTGQEPSWITKPEIDYYRTTMDNDAEDGYADMGYEIQVSLAEQAEYVRCSRRIISEAGVQNGSEISVSFDPSYQKLVFHSIRILRDGKSINKLQLSKIKTIQQEEDLKDFIYNGALKSVMILEDVRTGDIIEYSYTTKGFNPIFKNKYSGAFNLQFSVPVYDLYYKLIVPQVRKINYKTLNGGIEPVTSSVNGAQVYEWKAKDIEAVHIQDEVPSWYDPYAQVLLSEYSNWKEVNDWALELFPRNQTISASLQKKINELKALSSDEERVKVALRFVQDDIRYMGFEMGVNSHKPAAPSKVFDQRFGDCKEKSYLLCTMLWAMNIDASPVLINTVCKSSINDFLPSSTNFDHVTVRVKLNGKEYWFDPTISFQRGNLKDIYYPDYQSGLVVSANTTSLNTIAFNNNSGQNVKEYIRIPSMFGGATMKVISSYYGSDADVARDNFHNKSLREILKEYQKYYAHWYEHVIADSLSYADDEKTGTFTTTEYYSLPNLWEKTSDKGKKFSFYAFAVDNIIKKPDELNRRMPFSLIFPTKIHEEVTVELPEDWPVTAEETSLENTNFRYHSNFYSIRNKVFLEAEYENLKSFASTDESIRYLEDVETYSNQAACTLTEDHSGLAVKQNDSSGKNLLGTVVFLAAMVGGMIWWNKRKG